MRSLLRSFLRDRLLHLLLALALLLSLLVPFRLSELPGAVDWQTIITLAGLLLLTRGIESSGCFDLLGRRLIRGFRHQRTLALFMVAASGLFSTFLTNDVALFITVPLTLTLRRYSTLPVNRLIIFEALAVNAGSLLTPIGNPQNILLWSQSGLSFLAFIGQMLPLALVMMTLLLLLVCCCFRPHAIAEQPPARQPTWRRGLFTGCALLWLLFVVALQFDLALPALGLILLFFLWRGRNVLLHLDWSLLALFILMFVDVFLLTRLPYMQRLMNTLTQASAEMHYLLAVALSQVISNVPATILLLKALPASPLLAWAVNIGGFGLLPGSLANLIALRLAQDRRIWWQFHFYSVPVMIVAIGVGWLMILSIGAK